jgi:hypothetical protein
MTLSGSISLVDGQGAQADQLGVGVTLVTKESSVITEGQPWTIEGNVVIGAISILSSGSLYQVILDASKS